MIYLTQHRAQIGKWDAFCSCHPVVLCHVKLHVYRSTGLCGLYSKFHIWLLLILLLSGDVHPNPGPTLVSKHVNICHINARSLMVYDKETHSFSKFEEIVSRLVLDMKYDIICISETWLGGSIPDGDITISNYTQYRKDRNRHGGGVMIYVSDSLPSVRKPELEKQDIENIWIEVSINGKKVLLSTYYRPPIHGQRAAGVDYFINSFQTSVTEAIMRNPDCLLIFGDFNDRCVIWNDQHPTSELRSQLVDITNVLNLFQLVSEPTRYTDNSAHLLDLIFTDSPGIIDQVEVLPPLADLDHCIVSCRLEFSHQTGNVYNRQVWDYGHADYIGLNEDLATNLNVVLDQDIDTCVNLFYTVVNDAAARFIPNKIAKIRPKDKPYITHACCVADRIRDRCHKRFQRTRNPLHYEIFKKKRRFA